MVSVLGLLDHLPTDFLATLNNKDLAICYQAAIICYGVTGSIQVPCEMQLKAILSDYHKKDTLVSTGTDSGKTLPIALNVLLDDLDKDLITLTLSPLKQLQMTQESDFDSQYRYLQLWLMKTHHERTCGGMWVFLICLMYSALISHAWKENIWNLKTCTLGALSCLSWLWNNFLSLRRDISLVLLYSSRICNFKSTLCVSLSMKHPISTWLVCCTMDLTPFIWHGVVWTSWRHAFIGVCNGHFYLPPSHHIYTWWSRINYWDQVILPSTSPLTSQIPLMWCTKWWMILKICGRTMSVSSQVLSHWTLSLACPSLWTRRNWHATSSLTWTLVFLQSIVTWVLLCINITWCHRSICRLLTRPLQYWLECVVSCLQHWDSLLWVLVLLQSDSRPHLDASWVLTFWMSKLSALPVSLAQGLMCCNMGVVPFATHTRMLCSSSYMSLGSIKSLWMNIMRETHITPNCPRAKL